MWEEFPGDHATTGTPPTPVLLDRRRHTPRGACGGSVSTSAHPGVDGCTRADREVPDRPTAGPGRSRSRRVGPNSNDLPGGGLVAIRKRSSCPTSGQPPPRSQKFYRAVGPPPFSWCLQCGTAGPVRPTHYPDGRRSRSGRSPARSSSIPSKVEPGRFVDGQVGHQLTGPRRGLDPGAPLADTPDEARRLRVGPENHGAIRGEGPQVRPSSSGPSGCRGWWPR